MICEICKKLFSTYRSLGVHIKKVHNMTTKEYYITYIGEQQYCKTCGKPTKFNSLSNGFNDHCCNRCAQIDPLIAKKRENTFLTHFGYKNVMCDPVKMTNIIQTRTDHLTNYIKDNNLVAIPQKDHYMLVRICKSYNIPVIKKGQNCFINKENYDKVIDIYNLWESNRSLLELQILDVIKENYKDIIITNTKKVIPPKEIDIFLPKIQLAFEINGNYRHSKIFKDENYHITKTNLCKSKNIRLIHIFEYEWLNNKEQIIQIIKDAINNKIKTDDELLLDLSKESLLSYPNYTIVENIKPFLINDVYNCGYVKIKNNNIL